MNKMILAVLVAAFSVLTGCATSATSRPAMSPMPPPVAAAPMPAGPMVAMPAAPVPPARPESMMGPPQNWGWLHTPPYGCERGPNSLMIANETRYFIRLVLDGEDVLIRGAQGMFPELPPGATAFVCLSHTGIHTLQGVAFTLRYGVPQEVVGDNGRFSIVQSWGTGVWSSGRHELHVGEATLILH
jgi:hypothetical protein